MKLRFLLNGCVGNGDFAKSSCELPNDVFGGGPAGVKEPAEDGGGGPAGVVEGFDAKLPKPRPLRWLSGVAGGLEENGTVKPDMVWGEQINSTHPT